MVKVTQIDAGRIEELRRTDGSLLARGRFVDGRRYAWNPYLAVDLGNDWKLGLSYEYVHDDRVADRGVPSIPKVHSDPDQFDFRLAR